ncbi:hypothetical protein DYB38_001571 [Aphanomyces astaci]|uniref:Uncharacterized protein n=1 Tax=Aphanomyces astaci TaxID=112090 RepID=A0A397A5L7_APHAT|nr:hypothetical protein DYB36_010878 [Aphanomyces astaci]RHY48419.1 hypothetical protein DYB38_001571 [Aphanomyces astaci]
MSNRQVETDAYTSPPATTQAAVPAPLVDAVVPTPAVASPVNTLPAEEAVEPVVVQKNKGRCWECKKKVGLTGIECRCGFVVPSAQSPSPLVALDLDFPEADLLPARLRVGPEFDSPPTMDLACIRQV